MARDGQPLVEGMRIKFSSVEQVLRPHWLPMEACKMELSHIDFRSWRWRWWRLIRSLTKSQVEGNFCSV